MNKELAFVFPGQGSQSVGMMADLNQAHPQVKETFDEASEVFGQDMWAMAQQGPEALLSQTEVTQPIMFVSGVAAWRAWCAATEIRPALMAGHSLGEYTAYVCAGSISLQQGVELVKRRGELMRDACPGGQGKMAAILGLDDDKAIAVCADAAQGQVVQAVNFNSPGQVVIAGHAEAVDRAVVLAKEAGAKKAMPLSVSVPCHSDLMRTAGDELAEKLRATTIERPVVPVVNNIDAEIELDPARIRDKLIAQLYSPVLWVASVNTMAATGITTLVECGPGKVLCGMSKRVVRGMNVNSLQDQAGFDSTLEALS
ncbi:ACP S-malonyltransferase [Ketobacter alkanivorans]|uniref:Malonyl CoA-acyl carrier protein transacylase n=1 Tax=Ketobacter alkanivorans TaxID=1917421 RepID=A0A2K9LQM0_9GAMM|nr:ACP S-malonyltransferase [Ketobacter alkanivorans]AUM14628.1 [acyl-carrier-protein] S-malonyltransferase [Ketobacter alkanivorans]MCP5013900.1 ACP S-malonyltransferase [Ketobacter sp.]